MGKKYVSYTGEDMNRATQQKLMQAAITGKDKAALEWLLDNSNGRWFLARLMQQEGLTAGSFTGNSATFYNEGRREVVVGIYQSIKTQLGLRGIKLLHQAQEEMMEYQEEAERLSEQKEGNADG
jgi:hypothetical protein